MGFNVDVKWKIKFNGKEYSSVDEMPAAERAIYESAMRAKAASGRGVTFSTTTTKIVFNGKEYANADAMPEEVRETYRNLMKAVAAGKTSAVETTVSEAASTSVWTQPGGAAGSSPGRRPIVPESIPALRLVVGAVVLAALAALYFLSRG